MTCPLCGCGCGLNLLAHRTQAGQPLTVTVLPSRAPGWGAAGLCMRGWQLGEILGSSRRLRTPMVWREGSQESTDWPHALERAGESLQRLRRRDPASIGIVLGDSLSVEELFVARRFADMLGTPHVAALGVELDAPAIDGIEQVLGRAYRAPSPQQIEDVDLFVTVNSNLQHINPRAAGAVARRLQSGARMLLVDEVDQGLAVWSEVYARHEPGLRTDALRQLRASVYDGGPAGGPLAAEDVSRMLEVIAESGRTAVIFSAAAIRSVDEAVALARLAETLETSERCVGIYLLPSGANTFGAMDMLTRPQTGMTALNMVNPESELRGLIGIGEDLGRLIGSADLTRLRQRIEVAISIDSFVSAGVELADLALPLQMPGEREGAIRRPDGRLWLSQAVLEPAGQSRTACAILGGLAEVMGMDPDWGTCEETWTQIREAVPSYADVSLEDMRAGGLPEIGEETPRVAELVDAGATRAAPAGTPEPDERRPYVLVPRSTRGGWTTDPRCQGAHILRREATLYREPYALMAPEELERMEVRDGQRVEITSEAGAAVAHVRADSGIPPGIAVLPTEFPGFIRTLVGARGSRADRGDILTVLMAGAIEPVETR